jgi:protocatechuate 3,4-dioxygenase beta subunit
MAVFTVKDATAQVVTYTAVDTTYNLNIAQTATVTFYGVPTSSCSSVSASPSSLLADGVQATTITVKLCDSNGNPVTGATVQLLQGSGSSVISPTTATTDLTGTVQFSATDTTAETISYTPRDVTDSFTMTKSASVTFISPNQPDAEQSTVVASPIRQYTSSQNGTKYYVTITVTLIDSNGNPVSGKTVSLSDGSGNNGVIVTSTATSNASGQATFQAYDTSQEWVTYTATDVTDSVVINQTASVRYQTSGRGGD